jgi:F-type H+-transporting ATPase subunit epsilon
MLLKIVTPERTVVEDEVDAFYGNTVDGSIGILPKHVPMVAPLKIGIMHYVKAGRKEPLAIMGGMLYTDGQSVTVLSDAAELTQEIDTVRAQHAKDRAEALLHKHEDNHDHALAQQALARAMIRLNLVNKK